MKISTLPLLSTILFMGVFTSCSDSEKVSDSVSSATLGQYSKKESFSSRKPEACIILASSSEGNTGKIAREIASVLEAPIIPPEDFTEEHLSKYPLIGFGSGIFDQQHHKEILKLVKDLPEGNNKRVFILSTSGVSRNLALKKPSIKDPHDVLRDMLLDKDYKIMGEFNCPGFNRNSFLKLFGGMNKNRPNSKDLEDARRFAERLQE